MIATKHKTFYEPKGGSGRTPKSEGVSSTSIRDRERRLKKGEREMPEATKKGSKKAGKASVPNAGDMDLVELFDSIDKERAVRGTGHAGVSAAQIREIRDELFSAGKDKLSVATLCLVIDAKFGLAKTEDGDTRVPNASVRSAVKSGGYDVETIDNIAYVVRKA